MVSLSNLIALPEPHPQKLKVQIEMGERMIDWFQLFCYALGLAELTAAPIERRGLVRELWRRP